jgi:hypothetical protein
MAAEDRPYRRRGSSPNRPAGCSSSDRARYPGVGMRLQSQPFRKVKTVPGPRRLFSFVGLRCVSFPILEAYLGLR